MSRQELYAWASFGSTAAILGYYLIRVIGLPEGLGPIEGELRSVFIQVIVAGFVVEFVLDFIASLGLGGVHKDERDRLITLKGYRTGYTFFMVVLVTLAGFVILQDFQRTVEVPVLFDHPFLIFHILLVTLFGANLLHSGTRVILYRREA